MKSHRLSIVFGVLILPAIIFAQMPVRQTISALGGFYGGDLYTCSFTVGEAVIHTEAGDALMLTQGFQQPDELDFSVGTEDLIRELHTLQIDPNPFSGNVKIGIENLDNESIYLIRIVSDQGKEVVFKKTTLPIDMDLSNLVSGSYVLAVLNTRAEILGTGWLLKQ